MSIKKVRTYMFTCDTMRFTADRKFVTLCDGYETFAGLDIGDAARKARSRGWSCDDQLFVSTCPFHHHKLDAGQVPWPPVGSPLREQPEDGRELD